MDYDDYDMNPASVVRTARDERLWRMAKKSAAEQGRARDWPYIMGIFQHMKHRTGSEPVENPAGKAKWQKYGPKGVDWEGEWLVTLPDGRQFRAYRDMDEQGWYTFVPASDTTTFLPGKPGDPLATGATWGGYTREEAVEAMAGYVRNPDDEDDEDDYDAPAFQLRAAVVQQGLFAPSSYEAKPKKKKPAASLDKRQVDMFGMPIDEPSRKNPGDFVDISERIKARQEAERARRRERAEGVLGSAYETMLEDPGFQQEVRRRQAEQTMQRYAAGPQLFKERDRVVYAGSEGAVPSSWRGRIVSYEWHPEWDDDGDGHFYNVRWVTPEGRTHEGVFHQSDLRSAR